MFMNLFPFKDPSFKIQHSEKLRAPKIFKHPLRGQIKRDESLQYSMASRHDFGPWNLDLLWILDLGGWSFLRGLICLLMATASGHAFCGFYVAKADTKLFNKASQVVLVRHEDKTVLTMANDYQGDPKEFAIVIPVPTFLEKDQIHVGDKALLDHLDAYSAPRLVEYFDPDPCAPMALNGLTRRHGLATTAGAAAPK